MGFNISRNCLINYRSGRQGSNQSLTHFTAGPPYAGRSFVYSDISCYGELVRPRLVSDIASRMLRAMQDGTEKAKSWGHLKEIKQEITTISDYFFSQTFLILSLWKQIFFPSAYGTWPTNPLWAVFWYDHSLSTHRTAGGVSFHGNDKHCPRGIQAITCWAQLNVSTTSSEMLLCVHRTCILLHLQSSTASGFQKRLLFHQQTSQKKNPPLEPVPLQQTQSVGKATIRRTTPTHANKHWLQGMGFSSPAPQCNKFTGIG